MIALRFEYSLRMYFSTQKVLVKMKNNTRFYKCSHCPKQNSKLKEIIRHLRQCVLGKSFKVITLEFSLAFYFLLFNKFILIIKFFFAHQCEYCSKMFSQQATFLTHLTLHATAKTYQCNMCDKNFSNPTELKIHSK